MTSGYGGSCFTYKILTFVFDSISYVRNKKEPAHVFVVTKKKSVQKRNIIDDTFIFFRLE